MQSNFLFVYGHFSSLSLLITEYVQPSFFSPVSFVHIKVLIFIHYAVLYTQTLYMTSNEKTGVGIGMKDFEIL